MSDNLKQIKIADTTLRDGEQAPGVEFCHYEKYKIAEFLDEFGVDEVEIGTPAVSLEERNFIAAMAEDSFKFDTSCWSRLRADDIKMSIDTGVDFINISLPMSDILLRAMGKSREWLLDNLNDVLNMGYLDKRCCSIGLQDASRAEPELLSEVISTAAGAGFYRLRIADTIGILNPLSTQNLVQFVRKKAGNNIKLEFHAHNDLGMAVGNSLAAAMSGIDYISTTVNGLGERAGNCPMEAISVALQLSCGGEEGRWNLKVLNRLCSMVALMSRRELSKSHPVVGEKVYTHESGVHVKCLQADPYSYQLFMPELVGCQAQSFSVGKLSGSRDKFLKTKMNNLIK